jgi:ribonucleoside-diphosphate reductase alpha chain
LTNFRYLRKLWKRNCEEERLLGVSLTGIMDNPLTNGKKGTKALEALLDDLRETAIETNKRWADRLGIAQATAITCVKPSGTVSQLANCASGIHPNYSKYYIRTVRQDNKDPVTDFLKVAGVPNEPCFSQRDTTTVFSFPIKVEGNAVFRDDVGAIGQLEIWKTYQNHWAEHKPSITVYYKDEEFFDVCAWVWNNWEIMSGISMLPYNNGSYVQAPYQEITAQEYKDAVKAMPDIDFAGLIDFERGDTTTSSQELACVGGSCEI